MTLNIQYAAGHTGQFEMAYSCTDTDQDGMSEVRRPFSPPEAHRVQRGCCPPTTHPQRKGRGAAAGSWAEAHTREWWGMKEGLNAALTKVVANKGCNDRSNRPCRAIVPHPMQPLMIAALTMAGCGQADRRGTRLLVRDGWHTHGLPLPWRDSRRGVCDHLHAAHAGSVQVVYR